MCVASVAEFLSRVASRDYMPRLIDQFTRLFHQPPPPPPPPPPDASISPILVAVACVCFVVFLITPLLLRNKRRLPANLILAGTPNSSWWHGLGTALLSLWKGPTPQRVDLATSQRMSKVQALLRGK